MSADVPSYQFLSDIKICPKTHITRTDLGCMHCECFLKIAEVHVCFFKRYQCDAVKALMEEGLL